MIKEPHTLARVILVKESLPT